MSALFFASVHSLIHINAHTDINSASLGLLTYCWTCVANYYTELRDRAHVHNTDHASARSYIDPSAVTSPDAFTSPPPPSYSVVVVEEKPPCYEEAEKMQKV